MRWEIERHDWAEFGPEQMELPRLLEELASTGDPARSGSVSRLIEAIVIPVDGSLKAGADAVVSCLVQALLTAGTSRVDILELLFALAGGAVDGPPGPLRDSVRRLVPRALPVISDIAENGSADERRQCIDLLSMCARIDHGAAAHAVYLLKRIAETGPEERQAVDVELQDLALAGVSGG
jgi:hypothetical protein